MEMIFVAVLIIAVAAAATFVTVRILRMFD